MIRTTTLLASLLAAGLAQAADVSLSFQQGLNGYAGTQDTMIRSNETAGGDSRGLNYGSLEDLSVDGDDGSPGSKPNHGLIRFDNLFGNAAGQIRAGDTIVSAKLTVSVFNPGSGMTMHDLLVDWNQGTATWNSLGNGIQANGTDAGATVLASIGANNSSENVPNGALVFDLTASLQAAQAGAVPGHGWALLPFAAGTNGIDFRSSEYLADPKLRPLLSVTVTPVPEPGTWALLASGLALVAGALRRRRG